MFSRTFVFAFYAVQSIKTRIADRAAAKAQRGGSENGSSETPSMISVADPWVEGRGSRTRPAQTRTTAGLTARAKPAG